MTDKDVGYRQTREGVHIRAGQWGWLQGASIRDTDDNIHDIYQSQNHIIEYIFDGHTTNFIKVLIDDNLEVSA